MAKRKVLETEMAVIMDTNTPIPKVRANPLTEDVPSQKRIMAVMIEEIFESRMESQALLNPSWKASMSPFPFFLSSLLRSKIRTLASTAIPIERMNPAMPAEVKVTGISLKTVRERIMYEPRAITEQRPGKRYQRIRKIERRAMPIMPA